jgi:thioredoxin-related protein
VKLILSFLLVLSINTSSANTSSDIQTNDSQQDKIKTISAYEKDYNEIKDLIDPLKKNILIFSVTWCSPCKTLKNKLESNQNIDYSSTQILYILTDQDDKGERSEDGMPNPSMDKSLDNMGQGYWPFIMLFEAGSQTPISKFPLTKEYTDPCPNMLFYDRIIDFISSGNVCR